MNKIIRAALILIAITISCDTTESGSNGTLFTELADVSCTECWIKIETTGINLPQELTLYRDNELVQTITLTENDAVLYDSLLSPAQTYKYKVKIADNTSKEITVTSMDTTSHDFAWETFTFGEHSSSVLNDVAIIDENNIWAVGEIYLNDSSGSPDPYIYNAVNWDGEKWNLEKITVDYKGNSTLASLEGIFILQNGEIILTSGLPYLPQANSWKLYHLWDLGVLNNSDGGVTEIWGTEINNLYFAGRLGSLVHYDGTNWIKINSGIETNIYEIRGIPDDNGGYNKYCAADNVLLKLDVNNIVSRINAESDMYLTSVWGKNDRMIYTAGNGIVLYKNNKWQRLSSYEANSVYKINGQDYNDIAALSSTKAILHFNGYTWKSIQTEPENIFLKVEIKDDLIAAVGWKGNRAVITVLKR